MQAHAATASGAAALRLSCMAVASGEADLVVVVGVEKMSEGAATQALAKALDAEREAKDGKTLIDQNAQLMALYRQCAFCVYPSEYEGFGLPVIEAFRHGKAVIASTGGALPEVASGFAPCLEPGDVAAWTELMAHWISDREVRRRYEDAIRTSYRPISWSHAAARVFETIDARLLSPAKAGTKAGC